MMMFGFLILLYSLRQRWYLALLGALAWGFSSYFIIIIGAGHIWKFLALTYVPPTIAGFILVYRHRPFVGSALLSLFAMLQLNANHPQMTYYFGLVMIIIAICFLIDAIRRKDIPNWFRGTGLALVCGALAIGANLPSLYNTYEYSKETKRSQSELTTPAAADAPAERPTGGLPKSEIVGWSYGRSEMFSLLVPNIKGGASARPEGGAMERMTLDRLEGRCYRLCPVHPGMHPGQGPAEMGYAGIHPPELRSRLGLQLGMAVGSDDLQLPDVQQVPCSGKYSCGG